MRAVIQRSGPARVEIDGQTVGSIDGGLVVLLGVGAGDAPDQAAWLAHKIAGLRIFADESGRFNLSISEAGGQVLVVSQFTLWGSCKKGRRPSFSRAAPPGLAEPLYEEFCRRLRGLGLEVASGRFGAMMDLHLVNQGPVTLLLDTENPL